MPGLPALAQVDITIVGSLDSQTILSVLRTYVSAPSANVTVPQDMMAIVEYMSDGLTAGKLLTNLLAMQSNQYDCLAVRAQAIYPVRTIYYEGVVNLTGAQPGPVMTPNVALSITKRSAMPGRQGTGRLQIAGVPTAFGAAGLWDNTILDLAEAVATNLENIVLVTDGPALFFCTGAGANASGSHVIDAVPQQTIRTMHRRTVGLGI